jgi:hypothetical protein
MAIDAADRLVCGVQRALAAAVLLGYPMQPSPIVGRWTGESICVKAEWNAACNDEQVIYEVERSPKSAGGVVMHAFKLVRGAPEWMGDLDLTWNAAAGQWTGDFSNTRVRVRWHYRVVGDSLTGGVTDLVASREGRHVAARRDASPR